MKAGYWPAFGDGLQPWGANGIYPIRKERRSNYRPPDHTRKTPRHGVLVPTMSVKQLQLYPSPQHEREYLALIDAAVDIADAISNGNGDPVPQSVDAACKECALYITPTTRNNIIAYLKESE